MIRKWNGWCALVLAIAACGCAARTTPNPSQASAETPTPDTSLRALAVPSPAAHGNAIGATDSLIHAASPALEPWLALWREAMPGFAVDSLIREGERPGLRRGITQPIHSVAIHGDSLKVFSIDSPGGRHTLVVDRYQSIIDGGGVIGIGGGQNSAPVLLDRVHGTASTFGMCGSACAFEWGAWIDPTRFVIAGSSDEPGYAGGFIDVCSIADSTQTRYWTRAVTEDEFRAYRQTWGMWVQHRYRELESFRRRL